MYMGNFNRQTPALWPRLLLICRNDVSLKLINDPSMIVDDLDHDLNLADPWSRK